MCGPSGLFFCSYFFIAVIDATCIFNTFIEENKTFLQNEQAKRFKAILR
jgi:hypothetical protein